MGGGRTGWRWPGDDGLRDDLFGTALLAAGRRAAGGVANIRALTSCSVLLPVSPVRKSRQPLRASHPALVHLYLLALAALVFSLLATVPNKCRQRACGPGRRKQKWLLAARDRLSIYQPQHTLICPRPSHARQQLSLHSFSLYKAYEFPLGYLVHIVPLWMVVGFDIFSH